MFIVVQHDITDPELFWQKASGALTHPPTGLRLHSTLFVERKTCCQSMWEAESIDAIREFLEPELGGASNTTYCEVDPDTAIG
ncbi:hypothetical protein C9I98_10575 [Photobacterium sanctipauli]|uniref:Uncharacterized protein n=1 Tax=Photobacterium sanctipauli TaxID=1342794 RepID=A0A2T3NUG0_9GAMM|nr:hypothetical protein [Photobacterium sanctipauli]PSW19897.1 hypothetical protein C9I98_10575 [Photobacterium sanctipauli]